MGNINIQEKTEEKVMDLINVGAGGRLIIFKPQNSDKDLVVEKRGDYKKAPLYLKICEKSSFSQGSNLIPASNFYLVFVHFDIVKQNIEDDVFIVPSEKFVDLVKEDLVKFLVNKKDIGKFFMEKLL